MAIVCQPSTLHMLIWPEASGTENNIAAMPVNCQLESKVFAAHEF